ncbi:MAG: PAS domain S-box protein [bacterium]|nr:PAS domain S-box protein [bacterium]
MPALFVLSGAAVFFYASPASNNSTGMNVAYFSIAILMVLFIVFFISLHRYHSNLQKLTINKELPNSPKEESIEAPTNHPEVSSLREEIALRKKAQEIAGDVYYELELYFNTAGPLCVIDMNHNIVRYNHAFADTFGIEADLKTLKCNDLWNIDFCESDNCPVKRIARDEEVQEYQFRKKVNGNKILTCIAKPIPFRTPTGELKGIVTSVTDITDKVEAELQAQLHKEQLIQADKMASLGVLVSGVAHEINNPNSFITLNVPMLKRVWNSAMPVLERFHHQGGELSLGAISFADLQEMIPEILEGMADGARRIDKIVTSLKDFARKEPEGLLEDVDIGREVAAALTLLNNLIRKSTNKFSLSYGPEIPTFKGNSQQIEQLVVNLVINACQALPDSSKGVYIATSYDKDENNVVLVVRDEGSGITEDKKNRIFDPFYTTKRDSGGTGLGLSISAGIVSNHNGTITVDSSPDSGTLFKVAFPL